MNYFEKIFNLKENNTDIKTEILSGFTTFFTMAYLFILSPKLLEYAGMDLESSITVTSLVVFIGSLFMAFISNKPYAVAPFLGETAFIAYTIIGLSGFSIKTVFASIFISGIILLFMTFFNIRTYIINKIPDTLKTAYCCGLGLFFIYIALKDIGIVNFTIKSIPVEPGKFLSLPVFLGLICFILIIILTSKKIKSAVLISIIITTTAGILLKDITLPSSIISLPSNITSSLFQFDFKEIISVKFLPVFFIIFILINIDTSGAIISLSYNLKTNEKDIKKTMIADSLAIIAAPILGTTTPGRYIDSITGINAGGRTGLTSLTTGILFLFGLIFIPLIMIIPSYAYAPALLYVGILMTSSIVKIDFKDITEYAPALLTISIMIFTYNIGIGIMSGFLIYPVFKILCNQKNKTNIISWIMFVISIVFFIIFPYN